MISYLNDAWLTTVKKRERLCVLVGLESLLNPRTQLGTRLHTGLEPGVGSRLEYEYSVTCMAAQCGLV